MKAIGRREVDTIKSYAGYVRLEINPKIQEKADEAQVLIEQLTRTMMDLRGMNILAPAAVATDDGREEKKDG